MIYRLLLFVSVIISFKFKLYISLKLRLNVFKTSRMHQRILRTGKSEIYEKAEFPCNVDACPAYMCDMLRLYVLVFLHIFFINPIFRICSQCFHTFSYIFLVFLASNIFGCPVSRVKTTGRCLQHKTLNDSDIRRQSRQSKQRLYQQNNVSESEDTEAECVYIIYYVYIYTHTLNS